MTVAPSTPGEPPVTEQYAVHDVAPDDQRFLMLRGVNFEEGGPELILVENFFEELKAKVGN